ncbi:MAG: FecR domain-containing protein [Pseudomonadota bacterium]
MTKKQIDEEERLLREALDWRACFQSGDVTKAVRRDFEFWLAEDYRHEDAYERAMTYSDALDHLKTDDIDPKHLDYLLVERVSHLVDQIRSGFSKPALSFSAAAIVLAVLPTLYFAMPRETSRPIQVTTAEYMTEKSEQSVITLSDGTRVTLDASTKITTAMTDTARRVTLSGGAALFDVTPDAERLFSVIAGDLRATAKGTTFSVRNNGGVYRVAVAEGTVEVSFPFMLDGNLGQTRTRQLLEVGEQVAATNDAGLRPKASISVQRVGAWRESILLYDGATLGEMIADANRFSEREIILEDSGVGLSQRQISGSFRTDDVPGMLSMMSLSFDVHINESDPDQVVITTAPAVAH